MDIVTREDELRKDEYQLGDVVEMRSGFYILMKHRDGMGDTFMFTDTIGGGATGQYESIEELIEFSESHIITHFPKDEWKLMLVKK